MLPLFNIGGKPGLVASGQWSVASEEQSQALLSYCGAFDLGLVFRNGEAAVIFEVVGLFGELAAGHPEG